MLYRPLSQMPYMKDNESDLRSEAQTTQINHWMNRVSHEDELSATSSQVADRSDVQQDDISDLYEYTDRGEIGEHGGGISDVRRVLLIATLAKG